MAKKKSNFNTEYKFEAVTMSAMNRADYSSWIDDRSLDVQSALLTFVDNEIKVSVTYDDQREAYSTSITFKTNVGPNSKHIYAFRHGDLEKSIFIALWYFEVILQHGEVKADADSDLNW